jgi:hypothetical protein
VLLTGHHVRVLRRCAVGSAVLALLLALVVSLIPISGHNVRDSGVDVSCGPAALVAFGWTRPANGDEVIYAYRGAHYGVSARAWCQRQAGLRMVPAYKTSAALFALALVVSGADRLRGLASRRRHARADA